MMCSKNCDNCCYRKKFVSGCVSYCDYICMTGQRRPCPAGDGCTVKVTRRVYRKRKLSPEEIAAAEEKRREKERIRHKAYYELHKNEINARAKEKRLAKRGG